MQEYFLTERGIAYRTNTFVSGRKTLLFVHGLSGTLSAWYAYEPLFEKDYNIITFDLRGHGASVHPKKFTEYALEYFADDMHSLLAHLGVSKCFIISHSFGAVVALEFVRRNPDYAEGVIFLAPPYRATETWLGKTTYAVTAVRALLDLTPWSLRPGKRLNYTGFAPSPDWSLKRIAPEIYQMGLRSYLRCLQSMYAADTRTLWNTLHVPVLIVHGTDDAFVPYRQAQALAAALPHSRLITLEGANHMLVLNNVTEITADVKEFVGYTTQ